MIGSEEQKRLDHLNIVLAPIIDRLSRASVPLCNVKGSQLPTACGSAVLIRIKSRRYLVTASHVFDSADVGRTLAVIMGKEFIEIASSRRRRTKLGSADAPDRTDLAIVELSNLPDQVMSAMTFLELSDIDPFGHVDERAVSTAFLGIGYPSSKQAKSLDGIQYRAHAQSFVSHREAIWRDNLLGIDSVRHIAIGYDTRGFEGEDGVTQMPKPVGCSGGGLWKIPLATSTQDPQAMLVGIMIEHHSKPYNVILASRVWNLLGGLRAINSDNRSAIDSMFPLIEERANYFYE